MVSFDIFVLFLNLLCVLFLMVCVLEKDKKTERSHIKYEKMKPHIISSPSHPENMANNFQQMK